MSESLDTLFRCEYFGRDLLRKHCLRRQLECQEAVVVVRETPGGSPMPPRKKQQAGPPVHGHCASGKCEQGRAIQALFPGLQLGTCGACGTALIGTTACPTCAARAADAKPPHVLPVKPQPSERIWKENLPEAPFVPPATGMKRDAARASPAEPAHGPPSARLQPTTSPAPARDVDEEDHMPKGMRRNPCTGCGSKGTRHIGDCPEAKKKAGAPRVPKLLTAHRGRPRIRTPAAGVADFDPFDLTDDQLAACVREARERGARIQREAAERLAKLGEVLKAAQAPATGTGR